MFRKKETWIVLAVLFVLTLGTSFSLFKNAFPILNIDLKMNCISKYRENAIDIFEI